MENDQIVDRLHCLIRPPRTRFEFTHVHNIRWSDVAEQPTFGELWPIIKDVFSGAGFIAAHNASFDKGVFNACCLVHEIAQPPQNFVCTVKLARQI